MAIALLLQQTTAPAQAPVSGDQLREQIRETVRQATEAARQAAADARAQRANGRNIVLAPPALPGQTTQQVPIIVPDIPPQAETISIAFFVTVAFIIVGLPLMRAIARRIDKGTAAVASIPREVREQLQQISQSVDAIAIEVERISEGQRFTTKMLADKTQNQNLTVLTPGSQGQ